MSTSVVIKAAEYDPVEGALRSNVHGIWLAKAAPGCGAGNGLSHRSLSASGGGSCCSVCSIAPCDDISDAYVLVPAMSICSDF